VVLAELSPRILPPNFNKVLEDIPLTQVVTRPKVLKQEDILVQDMVINMGNMVMGDWVVGSMVAVVMGAVRSPNSLEVNTQAMVQGGDVK